jgi:hypothetical protein
MPAYVASVYAIGYTFDTADTITPGTYSYTFTSVSARHYFKISVIAGVGVTLRMVPPGSADYDLYLFDPARSQVASSEGSTGYVENISYTALTSGYFYIQVYNYSGTLGTYTLTFTITKIRPTLTCSVSASEIIEDNPITVSGSISPAITGIPVTLTYTRPDGTTFTRTATTGSGGSYSDTTNPSVTGAWSVKASWSGDSFREGASSSTVSFTVKTNPIVFVGIGVVVVVAVVAVALAARRRRRAKPAPVAPPVPPPAPPPPRPVVPPVQPPPPPVYQPPPPPPGFRRCPHCGAQMPVQAAFCGVCGRRIE